VRVLLDECVDWRLARAITGHDVRTVHQMGWAGQKNGALLALASDQFDVFITVDQGVHHQQNARMLQIAIVVLRAKTNRLADLLLLVPSLRRAVGSAKPGDVIVIEAGPDNP